MIKYETLPTTSLPKEGVILPTHEMPELVHLDDPAFSVMTDFNRMTPHTIAPNETMDDALNEMKVKGVHLLLVINKQGNIKGIIGSEDILGEKPIQLIQQRRVHRSQVLVKMIMVPLDQISAFDCEVIEHARVGNIVNTLKALQTHYVLVVKINADKKTQLILGLFTTSQISKQLHMDIANSIAKAQTLSELQERQAKK